MEGEKKGKAGGEAAAKPQHTGLARRERGCGKTAAYRTDKKGKGLWQNRSLQD